FFAAPPDVVAARVRELPSLAVQQLGWTGCVLAIVGAVSLCWRSFYVLVLAALRPPRPKAWEFQQRAWGGWRLAWLLGSWAALSVDWGLHYFVFDYPVFYIPALLALSLLAGAGAAFLLELCAAVRRSRQQGVGRRKGWPDLHPIPCTVLTSLLLVA